MRRKFAGKANVATIATLGVLATVGVGYAAIPAPNGQIKACYATSSSVLLGIPYSKGDTRIIDSAESCRSYERSIAWSQAGLRGDPGEPGSPGADGPQGSQGPQGPAGGLSGYQKVGDTSDAIQPGTQGEFVATCPAGKKVLGGGFERANALALTIVTSMPHFGGGWRVVAHNPTTSTLRFNVYAICADAAA